MKILIIGGTRFLGRATVEAALARGHAVTLFNRGQSNPDLFPQLEHIVGDRDANLELLKGRTWDAVIDTCGYVPRIVRKSAELLAGYVGHYTFISSISVYADSFKIGITEEDAVGTIEDESVEEITGETYGPLKALCEQDAEATMPGHVLTIRPGLIVGPHDPTDRFTYWPVRVARGGEVLVPHKPDMKFQVIDARDLGEWNVRMVEQGKTGVYNATGPEKPLEMGALMETCRQVSNGDAHFTWVEEKFLLRHEVMPWMELPLWIPEEGMDGEGPGTLQVNIARALEDGLTFRSLADTVADTLAWNATRPADHQWRAGMKAEHETELLRLWKEVMF
jgi:2'-hydroxyisoflavone reductase